MDEVMYGVMFNAKIDILSNEPPVNASKKLNASPALLLNHCLKKAAVNTRYRDLAADTDDKNHPYQIQQLASHFFHSKNIFKSFKH